MDGLLRCLAYFVVATAPLLVSGKRDLEAEFDALVSQFDEMKFSHQEDISKLKEENEDLRQMNKKQREDHDGLRREHENLKRNYEELQRDQNSLMRTIGKLKQNHKDEIMDLKGDFNQSLNTLTNHCNKVVANTPAMSDSKPSEKDVSRSNVHNGGKLIHKRSMKEGKSLSPSVRNVGDHSEQAAFYTYLSHDVADLGANQVLVFDKVITNLGNLYNGVTGVFTCDFPGTYVFHVHLLTEPRHKVYLALWKNNDQVSFIYAESTDQTYKHGGNTAILQLQQGDSVTVREYNHNTTPGNAIDYKWTSFSGFLLYAGDIEPSVVG